MSISKASGHDAITIDIEFAASVIMTGVGQMQAIQEKIVKNLEKLLSEEWEPKYKFGFNLSLFMHQRKLTLYELVFLEKTKPKKATYAYLMNGDGDTLCSDCASTQETGIEPDSYTWVQEEHEIAKAPICDRCQSTLSEDDIV